MASSKGSGTVLKHLRELFARGTDAGMSDGQLLARYASANDGASFEALVARHGAMVLATCRAILKHEHDVEDAFQATFLVLARKAGSVRRGDTLGGWLHRVSHRVAVEASLSASRRRKRESEGFPIATIPDQADPRPDAGLDVVPLVHEELDRLPEGLRSTVVLCDLEGLTYEQAAERLQWSLPTFRHRLSKARRRLRTGLIRRGLPAALVGTLVGMSATAARPVPASWAFVAVSAATGGSRSTAASALSRTILRSLFMTQLRNLAATLLATAALATAGAVASRAGQSDKTVPDTKAPVAIKAGGAEAKAEPTSEERPVTVRGRVIDPDGKPVVGANLRPTFLRIDDQPGPETTSGAGGQFLIQLPRPDASMRTLNGGPTFPWLIASAPGFGPVLRTNVFKAGKDAELTFRLVKDGSPIEGRIVDLEGRPVAEAQVKLEAIWFPFTDRVRYEDTGDLSDWLKVVQQRGAQGPWDGLEQLRVSASTKTGPDGRFRLTGIGRERVAHLRVSGPTITTTEVFAMTRNGPGVQAPKQSQRKGDAFVLHSPRFEQALAPTQPIEGVVRDKDTGKPVAGVLLRGGVTDPRSKLWVPGVETTSDAQGRYRLAGLPRSPSYQVFVEPGPGLPYPKLNIAVPATVPGLNPVHFDLELKRGVLVRGRVTDKATGRPVFGFVEAFTFSDNPRVAEFPGYRDAYTPRAYLDDDGRYELATLPGHGIIACRSDMDRYLAGIGADTLKGVDAKLELLSTLPFYCHIGTYHILTDVDLTPRTEPISLDLQVDPGRMIALTVVDPEGKPVAPTKVIGLSAMFATERVQESSSIEVHGLDPSKPLRRVTIIQADRKLVGEIALKGDEAGPVKVRLQPWGTILGRVVGEDGTPRVGLRLSSIGYLSTGRMEPEDPRTSGAIPGEIYTDGEGRFRIEQVVPGLVYSVSVAKGTMFLGDIFRDVEVASGETKDLGNLKVVRPEVLGGPKTTK